MANDDEEFIKQIIARLAEMGVLDESENDDPIEELAQWANQVDAIPGCLGALLKAVHAALVDVYAHPVGTEHGWTIAEFNRWMPVVSLARHYTEDIMP